MGYISSFFEGLASLTREDTIRYHYESYPDIPWESQTAVMRFALVMAHHAGILTALFFTHVLPVGGLVFLIFFFF